jgi:O-antigen/teichoic acid export membrane protein
MGVAANTLYAFAQLGLTRFASVATLIALAWMQGPAAVGVFSLALTFHILLTGWWVGIDDKIIREIARSRAGERDDAATSASTRAATWQTVSAYLRLKVLVTAALCLAVIGIIFWGGWYTPDQSWFIALLLVSSISDNGIFGILAAYAGHERFSVALVIISLQTLLRLLLTGLALWRGTDLLAIAGGWLVASLLTALFALLLFVLHFYDRRAQAELPQRHWSSIVRPREDWSFVSMGIVVILEYQLDIILLSFFRSPAEVGYYSFATTLFSLATLPAQAFRTAIYPAMSRLAALNGPTELSPNPGSGHNLQRIYAWSLAGIGSVAIPSALLGLFFAQPLIALAVGPKMAAAVLPTQILMAAVVLLSLNVPHSRFLLATNQQEKAALFITISAVVNVLANLWLGRLWGAPGAAIARSISTLTFLLLAGFSVRRFVRLPGWRLSVTPLGAGLVMAGFLLLTSGWLWWLSAVVALLLYAGVWWWLSGLTQMRTA